jgi:SAM-dependent methyltransferase
MDSRDHQFSFVPPHQRIFERVLRDRVRTVPKARMILDVGSGLGHWIHLVSGRWHHNVVGLEIDAAACGMAAANSPSRSTKRLVLYDGRQFPFADCSFELAYAHEVIEHVEHDPNASQEPLDPMVHAAHLRHYTASQLRDKLQEAGFVPQPPYWRMHRVCAFLDDWLTALGRRTLRTQELQAGMSIWRPADQRWQTRAMLRLYSVVEPLLNAIVCIEFELLKRSVEARSIIMVAEKPGRQGDAGLG